MKSLFSWLWGTTESAAPAPLSLPSIDDVKSEEDEAVVPAEDPGRERKEGEGAQGCILQEGEAFPEMCELAEDPSWVVADLPRVERMKAIEAKDAKPLRPFIADRSPGGVRLVWSLPGLFVGLKCYEVQYGRNSYVGRWKSVLTKTTDNKSSAESDLVNFSVASAIRNNRCVELLNLKSNREYVARVRAVFDIEGSEVYGPWSERSHPFWVQEAEVTLPDVPDPPTLVGSTESSMLLSWKVPQTTSKVIAYNVRYRIISAAAVSDAAASEPGEWICWDGNQDEDISADGGVDLNIMMQSATLCVGNDKNAAPAQVVDTTANSNENLEDIGSVTLNNLDPTATYEIQVQAVFAKGVTGGWSRSSSPLSIADPNSERGLIEHCLLYWISPAVDGIPWIASPTASRVQKYMNKCNNDVETAVTEAISYNNSIWNFVYIKYNYAYILFSFLPGIGPPARLMLPLWRQLRMISLIAALYGHDVHSEDVQCRILLCLGLSLSLDNIRGIRTWGLAKIARMVASRIVWRYVQNNAIGMAVRFLPLSALIDLLWKDKVASYETARRHFSKKEHELDNEE